jgi:hypothetical protein
MQSFFQPCKFTITVNDLNETNLFRSMQRRHFVPPAQNYYQAESDDVGLASFDVQQSISLTEHVSLDPDWDELYIEDKKLPLRLLSDISRPAKVVLGSVISLAIKSAPELFKQYLPLDVGLNQRRAEAVTSPFYNASVKHDFEKIKLEMDIIDNVFSDIRFLASTVLAIFEEQDLVQYQNQIFTPGYAFHPDIITALETGSSLQEAIAGIMGYYNMERIITLPVGFDIGEIGLNSPLKATVVNIFIQPSSNEGAKEQIDLAKDAVSQAKQSKYLAIVSIVIGLLSPSLGAPITIEASDGLVNYFVEDLRQAANHDDSTLAQQMLAKLGYYTDNIDGLWGEQSIDAASRLCSDMNVVCRDYHSQVFIIHLAKLMEASNKRPAELRGQVR